ncbi:MAG: excinuclease ABC subunit UvrA [Bacteroidales bacterium]|jgi:excinuclease ABC subunit A|nr:excinuclease ABC subunit UvrA [Bacteroidales bacterium]
MQTNKDQQNIVIKGARLHNLKHIDVVIERNKLVVITGLSGSGKSTLAFDTLYAEGQRRYVESLSSYARQFLGRINKPEVKSITGISPTVAIEQRVNTRNPRSAVGTSTEIYEYLKLLFARVGKTYSPISGELVKRDSVKDVVDFIFSLPENTRFFVLAPISLNKRSANDYFKLLLQQGFSRLMINGEIVRIDTPQDFSNVTEETDINIVIDRMMAVKERDVMMRCSDSVQSAFYEGKGICYIDYEEAGKMARKIFSDRFEADEMTFEEPTEHLFSFNNPYGACKTCEGFGFVIGIDEDLVIPDKTLSIYEGAVAPWKGEKMGLWRDTFVRNAMKYDFPIHKPYAELTEKQKNMLWKGASKLEGIDDFFDMVSENSYKIQYKILQARYRGKTICPECHGTRLRKEASYVKIDEISITDMVQMPIETLLSKFRTLHLDEYEQKVSNRLFIEITKRLEFLTDVGLGYLTLNRLSNTLSGGESQRIQLATSLGSNLVGSIYILDEPSVGLHSRDTQRLIALLKKLRDYGNTVVVVEHDEEVIHAADQIIDIGPLAGYLGGEVVFSGTLPELMKNDESLTSKYLSGKMSVPMPSSRRTWKEYVKVIGAQENNLKNIDVTFPLHTLTVVSGVSGSGKTTLVKQILYPALKKRFDSCEERTGLHCSLEGSLKQISNVEMVDQNPIGRSSRSNPATYIGAYDDIRNLYASLKLAKTRGYKSGFFSFNVPGGRCETCEGEGKIKVEMQFMADVWLECQECGGKRFKKEVLDVKYQNINISELLEKTIDEAIQFFKKEDEANSHIKHILEKLKALQDTGLGYLKLGQPTATLSGGEAQRVKLAYFLSKANHAPMLFIFDEPTTGLHFHDISKLLQSLNALIDRGHSVIVVEHNLEMIKAADWVIDLGLEGGEEGGNLLFAGTPEDLMKHKDSYTAKALLANKIKWKNH